MGATNLGDWCKWLEKNFSQELMVPKLPVIIRLDGNNFSQWTKKLAKPFDQRLIDLMIETTKFLVKETNAVIGYTQSDEITLILYSADRNSEIYNNGKKQKILSKLTAKCTYFFNEKRKEYIPENNKEAIFDCRIYQVPTLEDATSQLLWRENDATRNSILNAGYSVYSSKELFGKKCNEVQELLFQKNINWNDYPVSYKRGTYIKRIKTSKPFSKEEIESLPKNHNARKNPNLIIERNIIEKIELPVFNTIQNKVGVIFFDETPIIK